MGIEYDMQEIKDEFWVLKELEWSKETVKKLLELAKKCKDVIKHIKDADDNRSIITKRYFHTCKQELNSLKQQIMDYCSKMQLALDMDASYKK